MQWRIEFPDCYVILTNAFTNSVVSTLRQTDRIEAPPARYRLPFEQFSNAYVEGIFACAVRARGRSCRTYVDVLSAVRGCSAVVDQEVNHGTVHIIALRMLRWKRSAWDSMVERPL
eukprot:646118-Amphidinium_carterae.1